MTDGGPVLFPMKGIVPSLNTPFDENGALDHASLERLVEHTIRAGCGGMLGLAVAGEHTQLSQTEKLAFIETVTEVNAGRIPFVVSVTAPEPAASIELASAAGSCNAAGVCVQLPDDLDRRGRLEFLSRLARHAPGLLMVQDLDWTGGGLPLDEIVHLFDTVDRFSWLKIETRQAGPKYSAVLQATDGALNVCGGWAVTQLMDAMARGVTAFIPTGLERVYVTIHRLYQKGDINAARTLFEKVLPILNFSNQDIGTSIKFFKELRKAEGVFDTSTCRVPTARYDAIQRGEANHALKSALALMEEVQPIA